MADGHTAHKQTARRALTVLITDGEQRAALAAVRSLGIAGHTVHVASARKRSIAGASRYAQREWRVPDPLRDAATFGGAIRDIARDIDADVIIPISEASLLAILPLRRMIDATIPFAELDSFQKISHKGIVLDAARSVGIATPEQRTLATPNDAKELAFDTVQYPIVVKPARSVVENDGAARAKFVVQHAASADELRAILHEMDPRGYPLLLQQRIVGPGVGIFVLVWDGQLVAAFSHERIREKPPSGGVSVYRVSRPMDDALLAKSRALLAAFDWNGVAMVEYKVDAATDTPYLMEINGRFWGSLQLAVDAGVDFPTLLLSAARGDHPAPVTTYKKTGSRWLWGDVDHLIARFRRSDEALALPPGSPSRWETVRAILSRRSGDRGEVLRLDDPRPFIVESTLWFNQLLGRE